VANAALAETGLLDAAQSPALQAVATLAARICGTPMAAVSLVEGSRQYFAGSVGLTASGTDRSSSFCAVAMQTPDEPMLVPDALRDPRFSTNPLVLGSPGIRSYAGMPLIASEGVAVGAVCALGTSPTELDDSQVEALRALGGITSELLEARRTANRLQLALAEAQSARAAELASRARLLSVVQHAPMGITLVATDGRYVQVNPAFAALVGRSVDELAGLGSWEVTVAEDAREDAAAAGRMLHDGGGVWRREKRYLRPDGSHVRALVTTSLVPADDGGEPVLLSQIESVEQRRAAESRLLELHSAYDGIISTDDSGRVTAWNLGAERLLGYSAEVMLGHGLERVLPTSLLPAHSAGVEGLRCAGSPHLPGETMERPVVHADGRRLTVELTVSAWSQDDRTGFTAVLRDITARRRTELLAELVRAAASTANSAPGFAEAARTVLADVCGRLGWVAGQAWTTDHDRTAVWALGPHSHDDGAGCPLELVAAAGNAPTAQQLRFDARTRVTTAESWCGTALGAILSSCGIASTVAVPVLVGGETVARLTCYLPHGADGPDAAVLQSLEQIGTLLGRVVERERSSALLHHQVEHDELTGLANRRRLLQEVSEAQQAVTAESGGTTALLLVDLDRFGVINSSFGHSVGDQVLQEAARRLREAAAPGDVVARLGGDEFVLLVHLPASTANVEQPALAAGRRVLAALSGTVQVGAQRLPLAASVGVCVIDSEHAAVPHYPAAVLRDADAALRMAKRGEQPRLAVFDSAMRTDAAQRLTDETDLAAAISAGGLELHYQPVVELASGQAVGAEALVRWPRPGHGLVRPDLFIPLAEQCGLIVELGRWVLRRACSDAQQWATTVPVLAAGRVSVNVATRQLVHPHFLDDVRAALEDSGLAVERLVLEITESALIEDREHTLGVLASLRQMGVSLALDDFGTGYSSLSWLQDLPADALKIDKSFIDPVTGPGQGTGLADVVLKLAEVAGLQTVAEGIETVEQADALRRLGCQYAQGYLWSRPLPLAALAAQLSSVGAPRQRQVQTAGRARPTRH